MGFIPELFTTWESLSFYREDYLIAFVVLPAVVFPVVRFLPKRLRVWTVSLVVMLVNLVTYTQFHVYADVDGFISLQMLSEGIRWVAAYPQGFHTYVSPHLGLLMVGVCLIAMLTLFLSSEPAHRVWAAFGKSGRRATCGIGAVLVLGTGVAVWTVDLHSPSMQRSVFSYMIEALAPRSPDSTPFHRYAVEDLVAAYRDATRSPSLKIDSPYWAAAQDYNVIYFVLETVPQNLLDLSGNSSGTPHLNRARKRSFVSPEHYTTSTLSNRALFSVFTSLYPPAAGPVVDGPGRTAPGILRELRQRGYRTAAYFPSRLMAWEHWMYEAAGFEDILIGDAVTTPPKLGGGWRARKWLDRFVLDELKGDIRRWASEDSRFAAAFFPQTGHAPWPDMVGDGIERDVRTRGLEIISLHDRWFGELLEVLDDVGIADRTLIVVVADHGIRHWAEDPSFAAGRPGDASFHVPMMLYAPGVVESTRTLDWATSHIDLGPTVASLLGVARGRELEQGGEIWDARLANRTIYYWAHRVEKVRGYRKPEYYALWNGVIDTVHVDTKQSFDRTNLVSPTSDLYRTVAANLKTLESIQRAWLRKALR